VRCDGMDVTDTFRVVSEAVEQVRAERRPLLVEAVTYRFRGHSMADPEQYRSKEEVAAWRERDPIAVFGAQLVQQGTLTEREREQLDAEAIARVDAAVAFADDSPFPRPEDLYDDVYVLGGDSRGWYSVQTTAAAEQARPEPAVNDEIPQQLTSALAAGEGGRGEQDAPG